MATKWKNPPSNGISRNGGDGEKFNGFKNLCTQCTEVVVDEKTARVVRVTKGVYLPVDHDCKRVRVYNLKGQLIEVKEQ